jgi:single-strand DNA-binding protein
MLNQVTLIGRIGRDPELRYTPSGVAVVSFSIAIDRPHRSSAGESEGESKTDWLNVVAWRQNAEFAANYLSKGRLVLVQGRLQTRNWVAQDGTRRSSVEVVADRLQGLDKPKDQAAPSVPIEEPVGSADADLAYQPDDVESDPFSDE